MTIKLCGYRTNTSARAAARRATTQDRPRLIGLTDGTVVGCVYLQRVRGSVGGGQMDLFDEE